MSYVEQYTVQLGELHLPEASLCITEDPSPGGPTEVKITAPMTLETFLSACALTAGYVDHVDCVAQSFTLRLYTCLRRKSRYDSQDNEGCIVVSCVGGLEVLRSADA